MAVVRLLRYWLPSPTELTEDVLTALEAEILAVLTAMTPQQRLDAQITLSRCCSRRAAGEAGYWSRSLRGIREMR